MAAKRQSAMEQHAEDVAAYVAAGGEESVQRVITAVYALTKKLDQWYLRQFADLGLTQGEWSVLASLAKAGDNTLTPSRLADLANVAPSSMTTGSTRWSPAASSCGSPTPPTAPASSSA